MLTQPEVVPYLLHHNLIGTAPIIESDLLVADVSRRNRNFKVISDRGPSYLLKQGVGPSGTATVAHEAAVYEFLRSLGGQHGLEDCLPHYYEYDPEEKILVMELLRNAQDLHEYHARRGRFSTLLARAMGKTLAAIHYVTRTEATNGNNELISAARPPRFLSIHRPAPGIFHDISSANVQLIKTVQRSVPLCQALDELRRGWRAETLIHYDIKWDNCLVFARSASNRKSRLKIVDWELACRGDPCWDVGSVFGNYLSFWLFSIPITGEVPPDRFMELARYPLERMQPAIRSFWQSYVRTMELDAATSSEWLLCAVKYGAARLVQAAYEQMQTSQHLTGSVVYLLQLSLNILQRPQEAMVHLLGLPLGQEWAQ